MQSFSFFMFGVNSYITSLSHPRLKHKHSNHVNSTDACQRVF